MTAEITLEPDRFGRTGIGVGTHRIRADWHKDAVGYALDAPAFIARGSMQGREQGGSLPCYYVNSTEARE